MRVGLLTLLLAGLAALAAGGAGATVATERTTRVASPPPENGPAANGPSDHITFSGDERKTRWVAFDSEASNLVRGDTNGVRDIFVIRRGSRLGRLHGEVVRVSMATGRNGAQANGPSQRPSLGGDVRRAPRCVAFESRAANLASADTSPDWDVYVRIGNRTRLASPGLTDAQNVAVDGRCRTVTFEAGGFVWVRDLVRNRTLRIARGSDPDQQTNGKGVVYVRGNQVYHRRFERVRGQLRRRGRELLVSRNRRGRPGNGASRNPVADDNGHYVAFDSAATNLCVRACRGVSRDRNGRTRDVFRRTISRRAPTRDYMQMASYSHPVRAQGNGDSHSPAMSGAGEIIVFVSEATNLRESRGIRRVDPNGRIADVFFWNFPRGRGYGAVSRESRTNGSRGSGQPWPAPVRNPAISNKANYLGWTSDARAAGATSPPGIEDVFIRFMGGR